MNKKAALEGLLFLMGNEGLTLPQIEAILEENEEVCIKLLGELQDEYNNNDRGIALKELGNSYKLVTKEEYKDYYKKLTELSNIRTLSPSALETLAIIAYNEPITRLEVDELRKVNSGQMIRSLIARDLVKEVGRSDKIGRPRLYGITDQFLDYFGLSSKDELPRIEEIEKDQEEIELYNSKYKEEI